MDPTAFLTDYTLRTVAFGTMALGATCGLLGAFAVLRGQSLVGDAIGHAALPGVALAFMLTGSRSPLVLALGAGVTGWLATRFVARAESSAAVRTDSALATALSAFFGVGLVLLTFLQRRPDAQQAGLDRYLFGQAATLLEADVLRIALFGLVALATVLACWKPFRLLIFDRPFGEALGFRMHRYDVLLTLLLVGAIVMGLEAVGVVLVSALVVAPGAAARQWTDRLGPMAALAAGFGALSGFGGALVSASAAHLPTGPVIVLVASVIALVSLLFAPSRGVIPRLVRGRRRTLDGPAFDDAAFGDRAFEPAPRP